MTVKYTVDAAQDLNEIALFIAQNNPDRALSFVEEIRLQCRKLADLSIKIQFVPEYGENIRRFPFGNYNIFYTIDDEQVIVVRVLGASLKPDIIDVTDL